MAEVNIDVALESSVQELLTLMRQGVTANAVKSVQRGKVNYQTVTNTDSSFNISTSTSGYNAFYFDVTINAVDTSKAFVNLFRYSTSYIAYLVNSTTLRVYISDDNSASTPMYGFSWEVVEYY